MTTSPTSHLGDRVLVYAGDCTDVVKTLADNSIDACVTDPPYALVSIGKRFGAEGAAPVKAGSVYARASAGFMQAKWDTGAVAFDPEFWREVWRVLKPGAHVVAFGATRTYHRLACAIEDAGFECRDAVMWHYGVGFPKSHDVSKGIDRAAGATRDLGDYRSAAHAIPRKPARERKHEGWTRPYMDDPDRYDASLRTSEPVTDAAREWEGWGTALKPATEIIFLGRKPLSEGTVAANVLRWGTGAINVGACRIETEDSLNGGAYSGGGKRASDATSYATGVSAGDFKQPIGRWPANCITDGSAEVVEAFPDSDGQQGDVRGNEPSSVTNGIFREFAGRVASPARNDSGSAARFFFSAAPDHRCRLCCALIANPSSSTESTQTGNSVHCDAVGSRPPESVDRHNQASIIVSDAETRSAQCPQPSDDFVQQSAQAWPLSKIAQNVLNAADLCDSCATDIAAALAEVRRTGKKASVHFRTSIGSSKERILNQSLASYVERRENTDTILTTRNLSELFGCAFHAIAENISSERNEPIIRSGEQRLFYSSKADSDDRLGSKHPTVKPVDLMQWLCRLITPPGGTILDPFAGTGTTGEAAFREGFNAVLVEREVEYVGDIRRRMALAVEGPMVRSHESLKARANGKELDHGPLFGGTIDAGGANTAVIQASSTSVQSNNRADGTQMVRTAE